ncbi:MAG: hypothetical protein ACE5IY_08595 [bacterium]
MRDKHFNQSDYMSLQLMEIETFRLTISQQSRESVSFQEAAMLWISEGHADEFRSGYFKRRAENEPASA